MAGGTAVAVAEASRLDEIGFPEFTTKLVTDVFDALVSSSVRQIQTFSELVAKSALSLAEYIQKTQDDVSGEQLLQILARVLPSETPGKGYLALEPKADGSAAGTLTADEVKALNDAVALDQASGIDNKVQATGGQPIDAAALQGIRDAVAKRVANDNFNQLKELVKMGLQRIVVDKGVIETRLTFNTYGSSFYESGSTGFNRSSFNFRARARTGGFLAPFFRAAASTSLNRLAIRTTNETQRDTSGSSVQIFGMVRIEFKSDYMPLGGG